FNPLHPRLDHPVDSIAAAATDADHLDLGNLFHIHIKLQHRTSLHFCRSPEVLRVACSDEFAQPFLHPFQRRSEEHTSELQSRENLVCRLLLEKKKKKSPI